MQQPSEGEASVGRRYALCVGIGAYTDLVNRNLRYAVADATAIAERLADPQRGDIAVTLLTESSQTTKAALDQVIEQLLSAPERQTEDLILLYFSCHGDVEHPAETFCLLPSDVILQANGMFEPTTLIGISDLTRWFSRARSHNIVLLLDVCHSGGAGKALQRFNPKLEAGPNYFILGAARQDQVTSQSSRLKHGLFTYCLLRAFEQPPTKDGWLTISQVQNFVSEEITWFAKDQPTQIQGHSVFVNPLLPLLRNPGYPELCPLPPFWNVPLQRNFFFTGQDDLLSQLASKLYSEQKMALTQPYAISGLGGVGKTQMALEYAYRHRHDYHAVLWARADTRENLIASFVAIASLLNLPLKDEKDQMGIVEAVKIWLKDRATWLLILDNADELALVKEFIPPAFRGHLLLTTRAQSVGGLAHRFEIETMDTNVGALLLLRRAGLITHEASLEAASSADIVRAREIAGDLGGLPLALDQAGAFIEEVQCSLQDYQERYRTRRALLLQRRGGPVPDHPPVATTWSLSFEKVEQRSPVAADLLRLCAFLHPDAIPVELIAKGASYLGPLPAKVFEDDLVLDEAIATLGAYSLVRRNPSDKTLAIHRLVQAVLKDTMDEPTRKLWAERAVQAVSSAFPEVEFEKWPQCERYLPHALMCTDLVEQEHISNLEAAGLLYETGRYLIERARSREAQSLLQQALRMRERLLGLEDIDTAKIVERLARAFKDQARYREAESLYRRALNIREKQLGGKHLDTAQSLNNLALFYQTQGKYRKAEPLYRQALAIYEQQLGADHSDTATSLNNLADLYRNQGKYRRAEPLHRRALEIREQRLGADHPDTAQSLNNLALLYWNQRKYAEAEPLYRRALEIREQQLGADHPDTAMSLNNLATLYSDQGKYEQAEPLLLQALAIYEQKLESTHPDIALSLNNLATLYNDQGKYEQAELLLQRALSIDEQAYGLLHPDVAGDLCNLAANYWDQDEYETAELLFKRALKITKQTHGKIHPNTWKVRASLWLTRFLKALAS